MTTIAQIIGLNEPKRGDVGMELEVEASKPLPAVNEKKWRSKEDGSLRGYSMEYYSSEPVKVGDTLHPRIKYLTDKLQDGELGVIRESPRTSFHVHNNVSMMTPTQVWTAACAFWLLENVLVRFCDAGGQTREGNCFCLRLTDAEASMPYLLKDLKSPSNPFGQVNSDRIRYMGLNLSSVHRFGSLETRTMRGTIDPDILYQWASENHSLISKAPQFFRDPAHLLDEHHRLGSEAILTMLLSPDFVRTLTQEPSWKEMIEENAGLLCEIAYFHDWGKYSERVDKNVEVMFRPAPRAPRANRIGINLINQVLAPAPDWGGIRGEQANVVVMDDIADNVPPPAPIENSWLNLQARFVNEFRAVGYEVRQNPDGNWEYRVGL